jgi:hypothetical protein
MSFNGRSGTVDDSKTDETPRRLKISYKYVFIATLLLLTLWQDVPVIQRFTIADLI